MTKSSAQRKIHRSVAKDAKVTASHPKKRVPARTELVINHRKPSGKSIKRAKTWRSWTLIVLVIVGLVGVAIMLVPKLFQRAEPTVTPSKSDTTTRPSVSQPEPTDPALDEPTALAQAQQRLQSTQAGLEQSKFSASTVVKLNIPLYKQTYGQSCEASALRMALAYRGITTNDMAILNQMGYDGQVAKTINGQLTWTDPHKQFVGDKDGDQSNLTGYGVFGEPIAVASEQNGRPAEVRDGVTVDWIVAQLYAGNPVILWGVSIKIDDATWHTADGTTVEAPRRTHTRLVVGFKGNPASPAGFYLNDPATGTEKYWTTAALETNIAAGIKQAVAVY